MTEKRPNTRQRLLEAAAEISRETGAGSLSLDAVAARAGTSKGGLLYHFPTKAALMEGMVEMFVSSFEETLSARAAAKQGAQNSLAEAYLELFTEERDCRKPPPSGLLAALAENPDFLKPVRRFERELLDRMKENSADPALSIVIFLVALGIRNSALINLDVLTDEEFCLVMNRLKQLLETEPA